MIDGKTILLANNIKENLNKPLNEFVAYAQVNGQSISYSRCVYCHNKTINSKVCQHCDYI